MKAGWRVVPLGELLEVQNGFAFSSSQFVAGQGTPLIRIRDLKGGNSTEVGFVGSYDPAYLVSAGDLLIGMDGDFACYEWLGDGALLNQRVCRLQSFSADLMPRFLLYGVNKYLKDIEDVTSFTTVKHLSSKTIKAIQFPLPPLDEQKRIVAVLDEAVEGLSRARANAEANLADAQVLALNQLRNSFTECGRLHPHRRIGDIAEHCLGKMLDKNKNQGALRPYLRNINVRWFEVDTSNMLEMRIEDREVERYSAKKGDLLICEGGYPGRAAVWDKDEPVFFQKALHRVRFSNTAYANFLMYFLFMKDATGQLKEHFTGSGIQHFTGQALAQFQMPFPDLEAAEKTVDQIEEMNATTSALERHYQTTISQISTLRQSLLQRAFSGELT